MSDLIKVIALLKTSLPNIGGGVYSGDIPESQTAPSILVTFTTNSYGRTVGGNKTKTSSTWRLTVVANLQSQIDNITDILDALDNSSDVNFQRINTNMFNSEQSTPDQPFCRAFYDLVVYHR
jgi:hypothetical protein